MQFDEFVGQVQARAQLPSHGDAEAAIRATLETLARRLDPGIAGNLAAHLPQEIGRHLTEAASRRRGRSSMPGASSRWPPSASVKA